MNILVNIALGIKKHTFLKKTWYIEAIFVGIMLIGVALFARKGWIEWLGVAAVFFTFMHASIAERLSESEGKRSDAGEAVLVECYHKLSKYFYLKEICWFGYFAMIGAWSAIVGVFIFLLYPVWRKAWRKYNPKKELL